MPVSTLHQRPQEFLAALDFTAAQTGFSARLIEKDYWCSLVLHELFSGQAIPLVFKGGTLLSKAYAGFNRLSEDLDFTVPTDPGTARSARSQQSKLIQTKLEQVATTLGLSWHAPGWTGHNNSTQYSGRLAYPAQRGRGESLLIEVGFREPLVAPAQSVQLNTLLLNPLFNEPSLSSISVSALSKREAYAEKVRAALTRKDPAIRDLYDLLEGHRAGFVLLDDAERLQMVHKKVEGLGAELAEASSEARFEKFKLGVETELRPVLHAGALEQFSLTEAWKIVRRIQAKAS